MRRGRRDQIDEPGQDSFLDIVANLVGILIILVMVIGAQATDAMVEAGPEEENIEQQPTIDVSAAKAGAVAVEKDIHEIDARIKRQEMEIAYRQKERDRVMQVLNSVEQELQTQRDELSDDERQRLETNRRLMMSYSELQELQEDLQALENQKPSKHVIEHLPTPMAKTVFGREVHFRLQGSRLAYVPWDELVEQLKQDAPNKVWKLKSSPRVTEVLGPVRGFRMKYTLHKAQQISSVGGAVAMQQRIELDRFVLIPVRDDLGEPLDAALHGESEFKAILERFEPDRTTVTVWVYPDSYDQFRHLKAELFRRGYATAGRPMPEGHPIGGSPDGSRSAAQ
jgi:hypothetical protein